MRHRALLPALLLLAAPSLAPAKQRRAPAQPAQAAPAAQPAAPAPPPPAPPPPPRNNAPAEPVQTMLSSGINRPGFHSTRVEFEIFGGVGPGAWAWAWGGFVLSPGARLQVPLTRNGPLPGLNNDLRLTIGAQVFFAVSPSFFWWLSAPLTLQWNFFLSEQWSVGLEAGLAIDVYAYDFLNCYDHPRYYCDRVGFHPALGVGLRRHLTRLANGAPGPVALSFRFLYPSGVQVGLAF